jgi:hypothetical protein
MSGEKFELMEQKDEQQILAELQGAYLDKFVYSFKQGGQEVVGISWAGIKEIAYRIGEIDTVIEKYEETDEAYIFIVKATHKGVGSRLGVSQQAKHYGNGKPDPFALQKALSKAQRNAIRGVIPEATLEQYLTQFRKQDKHTDREPPRYEQNQVEDDGSGVYDLASLNSYLLSNGVSVEHDGAALCEQSGDLLIVRSPAGADMYNQANSLLRGIGFTWVKGGYRWERAA